LARPVILEYVVQASWNIFPPHADRMTDKDTRVQMQIRSDDRIFYRADGVKKKRQPRGAAGAWS
jgi:P pilus assembly chaperone PapD